jgi:uncharacterized protein YkwD
MRIRTLSLLVVIAFGCLPNAAFAAPNPDSLVKGSGTAVYYYASTGVRFVFPDEKTYFTWFTDFSGVARISDAEMAAIPLAGSVTYRPGIRMLKLQTDPKTYAVAPGGILRWVTTEAIAVSLYGSAWNGEVDDLPDAFFSNYAIGAPIESASGYSPEEAARAAETINEDKGIPAGDMADPSTTGESDLVRQWREVALEDVNRIRAENGKPPLTMNPLLNRIASIHTEDMVRNGFFEHDGSLGESADDRIRDGLVPDFDSGTLVRIDHPEDVDWTGENLGQATMRNRSDTVEKTILRIHQLFLDEPPDEPNHRTTMLSTLHPYSEIGIGPFVDDEGTFWITEDFISIPR